MQVERDIFVAIPMMFSGERVRNTWAISGKWGIAQRKLGLIPHVVLGIH